MSAEPLNVLSLFAGIGGLELGLERAGMRVVGQVEIDPYCRRVLAKHWPDVPRHDDVRTAADWWLSTERPTVDVICGGFPCQDISAAGRRAGIVEGAKSSLWAYLAHAVRVLRPRYVLVENVSAILVRGLDVVAADLAEIGYDLRWDCVPAAALGAPHRRDRWFGIAYPTIDGRRQGGPRRPAGDSSYWARQWPQALADTGSERRVRGASVESVGRPTTVGREAVGHVSNGRGPRMVADTDNAGRFEQRWPITDAAELSASECSGWWSTEPDVGRVADGVPARVDRLRALGNAVVPQVAEHVGRLIVDHAAECAA